MNVEDQKNILQCLRDVLESAYQRVEPVCCGRPGQECCGSPEPKWGPFEQTIMDTLGPAEKVLAENVEAAGNCQGILDSSASEVSITTEMIEAGAQRLVAWEENSEWPDSWSPMVVAAARNDAERVLRSALNARPNHIAEARKMVKGNVALAGDITDEDGTTLHRALLIQFTDDASLRAAVDSGQCRFTVFGGEV